MGNLFSRSTKTTKERLEEIQNEIEQIEHSKWVMMRSQKHMIGFFLFITTLLYLASTAAFYVYYFEKVNKTGKAQFFACLLAVPLFIYYSKQCLQSYYLNLAEKNEERMMMLRKEKRNILDKVMETETYRVAKELLEKYDPATLAKDKSAQAREWKMPNQTLLVQRGAINASLLAPNTPRPVSGSNTPPNITGIPIQGTPVRLPPALTCGSAMPNTPIRPVPFSVSPVIRGPAAVSSLTRPIAPQDRSIVEKMVDYMIGDGPNNRYALICTHCASHNGMALKEEFEFLAFRCCYCMGFNPARKQKPMAPRLAQHYQLTAQAHNATITSATQRETAPLHVDEPESENEGSDKLKIEDVTSLFGADRMEVEEEAVVSSSDDGRENLRTLEVESQSKQTEVCQNATLPLEDKDDLEFIDKEEAQNT